MTEFFQPGDVIEREVASRGTTRRYAVLDPVRTSRGKLRLRGPRGGYMTTWWRNAAGLPPRYRMVPWRECVGCGGDGCEYCDWTGRRPRG